MAASLGQAPVTLTAALAVACRPGAGGEEALSAGYGVAAAPSYPLSTLWPDATTLDEALLDESMACR